MKKPKQLSSSFLFQKQLLHDYQTSKTSFSCVCNDEKEELHIQDAYKHWMEESIMFINRKKSSDTKKGF